MLLSLGVRFNQASNEVQEFVCFRVEFAIVFTVVLSAKLSKQSQSLE